MKKSMIVILLSLISHILCGAKKQTNIYFFYGSSFLDNQKYKLDEASNVLNHPRFCQDKPTVLYIHGWQGTVSNNESRTVIATYQSRQDHNILMLEWDNVSNGPYASYAVPNVLWYSSVLANALLKMTTNGFNLSSLHIVSHSLGVQLAGHTGREIQKKSNLKLSRITGLDAAKPLFYPNLGTDHITKNDAEMVDIIHTDAWVFGAPIATGTIDFWPSGGSRLQPSCQQQESGTESLGCSHAMSWRYYSESVLFKSSKFVARKCSSWKEYLNGECDGNQQASMGINAPKDLTGNFYLHVNSIAPFSRTENDEINHGQYNKDQSYNDRVNQEYSDGNKEEYEMNENFEEDKETNRFESNENSENLYENNENEYEEDNENSKSVNMNDFNYNEFMETANRRQKRMSEFDRSSNEGRKTFLSTFLKSFGNSVKSSVNSVRQMMPLTLIRKHRDN